MAVVKIPVHVRTPHAERSAGGPVRDGVNGSSQECVDCAPVLEAEVQVTRERVAPAHVCQEHKDLLEDVLSIADNLERALAAAGEETPIREGVALTHRGVMHILRKHGLERLEAEQQPFDPHWHEAVGVVSAVRRGVDPGTVVEVARSGYRRGTQLFRPARVVVAQ